MSHSDGRRENDEGEAREEAIGDLDVAEGNDVRGGGRDDGPEESITFVYGKLGASVK